MSKGSAREGGEAVFWLFFFFCCSQPEQRGLFSLARPGGNPTLSQRGAALSFPAYPRSQPEDWGLLSAQPRGDLEGAKLGVPTPPVPPPALQSRARFPGCFQRWKARSIPGSGGGFGAPTGGAPIPEQSCTRSGRGTPLGPWLLPPVELQPTMLGPTQLLGPRWSHLTQRRRPQAPKPASSLGKPSRAEL